MNKKILSAVVAFSAVAVLAGCGNKPEPVVVEDVTPEQVVEVINENLPEEVTAAIENLSGEYAELASGAVVVIEQPAEVVEALEAVAAEAQAEVAAEVAAQ